MGGVGGVGGEGGDWVEEETKLEDYDLDEARMRGFKPHTLNPEP